MRQTDEEKTQENIYKLSRREKEILQLASRGASNEEIGERCGIKLTTVKAYYRCIARKLERGKGIIVTSGGQRTMANLLIFHRQ